MDNIKAGAGKARIFMPEGLFPLEGYIKEETPIHARALLLDNGQRTAVLSLELPSVRNTDDMAAIKQWVFEETGAWGDGIWICTTHNLCTIHIPSQKEEPRKHQMFMESLSRAVRQALRSAVKHLQPVQIGMGTGTCDINTSRDIWSRQGWWNGLGGESREDKLLTVLRFESLSGKPVALLYHYPVKCCTVQSAFYPDGSRVSSSELAGRSSTLLEADFDGVALFFMGAAADMVPKQCAVYSKTNGEGNLVDVNLGVAAGLEFKNRLGDILAQRVWEIAGNIVCRTDVKLCRSHKVFFYPGQQFYNGGRPYHPTPDYRYVPSGREELSVNILVLGKTVFFGLMPETTAVTGIELRERAKGFHALLVSLVNGGKDYMADSLSYDRCTFSGTHSVFAKGCAEQFVNDAAGILEGMGNSSA